MGLEVRELKMQFTVKQLKAVVCKAKAYECGIFAFSTQDGVFPEAAQGLKEIAKSRIAWLDGLMTQGEFISGSKICLADILLYCFLKFGQSVGQPYDTQLTNIHPWFESMDARASAKA